MVSLNTWNKLNEAHANNPHVGDYWSDMGAPLAVVLEVNGDQITLCRKTVAASRASWSWDFENGVLTMTRAEFYDWLEYDTIPGKFWGWVYPESMISAVEYWRANARTPQQLTLAL